MPCYDDRDEPAYVLAEARKEWMHNSPVAEMLCDLMKQVAASGKVNLTADVLAWWREHEARDKRKRESI